MKISWKVGIVALIGIGIIISYQVLYTEENKSDQCEIPNLIVPSKFSDCQKERLLEKYHDLPEGCFDQGAIPCKEFMT